MPELQTLPLTKRDQKKLKFQKGVSLFLFVMLALVSMFMLVMGIVFVFFEHDDTAGMIVSIGAAVVFFLTLWIRRHYQGLKSDLKGGIKETVRGNIQDKIRHRSNCDFKINGITYHVNMDAYLAHEIGDQVLLSFGPASKVMLDIQKIEEQ